MPEMVSGLFSVYLSALQVAKQSGSQSRLAIYLPS